MSSRPYDFESETKSGWVAVGVECGCVAVVKSWQTSCGPFDWHSLYEIQAEMNNYNHNMLCCGM